MNAIDASHILSEYARTSTGQKAKFGPAEKEAADVDSNGRVNALYASSVLAFYAYRGSGGAIEDMREWLK